MGKKLRRILFFLFGIGFMMPFLTARSAEVSAEGGDDKTENVSVWKRTDIVLVSEKKYSNPYRDVDIDAVFTHEDGTTIHLYGFWNGGSEWRVRFAPTKVGRWTYTVTCSDENNASLNGVTGAINAVENTGSTDLDKHGFVRISDNGRYFVYDDGTPFYWLGDTNWQAPNYVSITQCNYPGCECGNQFKHEVDDRLAKGFTVYQTYFDSGESDGGGQRATTKEPNLWTRQYTLPNVDTFNEKIDKMFDYLADNGMVIALGYGVHNSTVRNMSKNALDKFSRYLTARYASYPIVWITAQEITGADQFDGWVSSARIVAAGDGYDHPQGAHQYPLKVYDEYVEKLDAEPWHQYYALQAGHGAAIERKSTYEGYWNNSRLEHPKPFVETEANYEDITCGRFNGYSASRISAWKANLCGSCGFTYGVTDVWANNYSTAGNTGWLGSYSFEPWYMGIDKPGSYEMKYMADFFKYVDFSKLVPRFNDEAWSDLTQENKVVSASDNADTYVAYFYNSDLSTGELRGLDKKAQYSAKWYDPLTGCFVEISSKITVKGGKYTIPEKPTKGDWVLLVTSRTDLGEYVTEKAYTDKFLASEEDPNAEVGESNRNGTNILTGARAEASSISSENSSAARSIDGDFGTWWCASNGSFPQSLVYELPEERSFNTFSMNLYSGTGSASYVLESSTDGKKWTALYSCEDEPAAAFGETSLFTCQLVREVTCKYLRITFNNVSGNWAAVVDAAAYVTHRQEKLPAFEGEKMIPEVKCSGSYIYDAKGVATDTVGALFDGDESTLWVPYAPIGTQTIMMDLGDLRAVKGLNIQVGEAAVIPNYRIEGSKDGVKWTIIADATLREKSVVYLENKRVISEALSGNYRYVKLLWLNLGSNTADKSIAEMQLYASEPEPEPEEPAKKDPDGKSALVPVLAAVGGAAVIGAAAATVVALRKKRKK
jgi:hypothetical protein